MSSWVSAMLRWRNARAARWYIPRRAGRVDADVVDGPAMAILTIFDDPKDGGTADMCSNSVVDVDVVVVDITEEGRGARWLG